MERSIIHLNVADFAVAVERALDPRLRGRPVVIAPEGAVRAAVYDMSEEAYRCGVRKGMALRRALRCCQDVQVLPPHRDRYEQAMHDLLRQTLPYSPLIETGEGDGHLFVDVTGTSRLLGPPVDLAWRLRRNVRKDLRLDPIWSLGPNKLIAKVATRLVKPDGECIVAPGEESHFLAPLPIHLVPGIERDDLQRFRELNLTRVSQAAALSLEQLRVPFGKQAMQLYEIIRGFDPSPVLPVGHNPPRLTADREFGTDTNDPSVLEGALYRLVETHGRDLRRRRRAARRVAVLLDYTDGMRCARQSAVRPASANDQSLFAAAKRALRTAWIRRVRVRHLRLICDRLVYPPAQRELFASEETAGEKRSDLISAVDSIRERFGKEAVRFGRTLAA
jgi:DNA polymerase-4